MAIESKIIVTAEDRTAAAFAAIERNSGKTAMAMVKLQGQMLKLAGVGSLVAFFRTGAQSTEKWRDEMARLDDITEKFFNTASDAGRIDPFIKAVKMAYTLAFGASMAIENMGLAIGSLAAAATATVKFEFAEARRIMELSSQDMAANEENFRKLREEINQEAPQGFAKRREEEAQRVKDSVGKLKKAEEERLKIILEHGRAAEDAIRAEMEISEGLSGAGLTRMGEGAVEERFQKEQEIRLKESEIRQQQRDKDIEALLTQQMTESDLLDQKYANDLQTLYDARNAEYLTEEQFRGMREQLELEHQGKMGSIKAQGELRAQQISRMSATAQTRTMLEMFAQMSAASAQHSRLAFNVNKVASIGLAVMKMYESAVTSFAWGSRHGGPWVGAAMAALAVALQLPNVNAIKNMEFGSGTSAPSIGGGGAMPVFNAVDTSVPALAAPTAATGPTKIINVTLSGSRLDSEEVRDLIMQINEEQADGVKVNVMPG